MEFQCMYFEMRHIYNQVLSHFSVKENSGTCIEDGSGMDQKISLFIV